MDVELVVIGAGPGGYAAAFLAADLGMKVAIVDQEPRLGGVCLLRGCIPSKALLHVARVIAEADELKDWGIEYPEPKVHIDKLRKRKEKVIDTLTGGLKQLAAKRKVEVIQARAQFQDSQTLRLSRSMASLLRMTSCGLIDALLRRVPGLSSRLCSRLLGIGLWIRPWPWNCPRFPIRS
jgi:dihydrolipoamide dehydrogenase